MSTALKPGYKQTAVGVIPNDWHNARIGEIATIQVGRDLREECFSRIRDSTYRYPVFSNTVDQLGLYGFYSVPEYNGDSVTVAGRGVGLGTAFARSGGFGAIGRLIVLFPDASLDSYLLTAYINQRVTIFHESGGIPQLTGIQIAKYRIAVPPIPEQRAIAGALSDVDALIGVLDQLIAKKRDLKQAAMQQLLTGQTRLPGFHTEWEVASFGSVFSKVNAKEYQVQTSEYQATGIFPIVDQGKKPVVGFSDRGDKRFHCPKDGVVIFGDHTCIVKFVACDFVVGADGTQILAAKIGHCARFHAFQLQHRGIPTTGYNRHFKFLKERSFISPPLREQTAIAEVLSDMDAELAALEQRRDKTRALKQGMMQELLTGRTRLI